MYLLGADERLVPMREQPYDAERVLQELIERYPGLLAGELENGSQRWLLIAREAAVPASDDGIGRWSLDHLFVGQDGLPTLVEVKRSSDTRIRREVVGQMLDYAANAVAYWPLERVRGSFEARCDAAGLDANALVCELVADPDADVEAFWGTVETNLIAGRIRLVFVADTIPPELRRIIEFLNLQMSPAEVVGLEVKQYVGGEELRTLVPRLVGRTEEAQQRKPSVRAAKREWDERLWFEDLQARAGDTAVAVAREIVAWTRARGLREEWGGGGIDGAFYPILDHAGHWYAAVTIWTYGRAELQFQWFRTRPPFDEEEKRVEFAKRLNQIEGVTVPLDAINRRPSIPLADLAPPARLQRFLHALDWFYEQARGV
jgi:hypothetical protein